MNYLKQYLRLLFISLVTTIGLLLFAEIGLRFVRPVDRFVTFKDEKMARVNRLKPNSVFCYKGNQIGALGEFKVKVRTNSLGYHDREYSFTRSNNIYRILVLGDSQRRAKHPRGVHGLCSPLSDCQLDGPIFDAPARFRSYGQLGKVWGVVHLFVVPASRFRHEVDHWIASQVSPGGSGSCTGGRTHCIVV